MRIVVAPDKFKGALDAAEVARAIADGLRAAAADLQIDPCPVADGGEGTVKAMVEATGGRIETRRVTGPVAGMRVEAPIGLLGDGETAVIEMASASGLHLLAEASRNPMRTTTYGTGELLRAAADMGVKRIIVGIGGSATIDGGVGCVQGWGGKVSLGTGRTYSSGDRLLTGTDVGRVASIEIEGRLVAKAPRSKARKGEPAGLLPEGKPGGTGGKAPQIIVACDVGNPLYGEHGAAQIFGPQKGATPEQVRQLDEALKRLAQRTNPDLAIAPGAGAAGGLGFGLMAFFNAQLKSGIEIVMDVTKLRQRLAGADLCITGEGRFDVQSLSGKTPIGVARLCRELNVPCIALAGSVDEAAERSLAEGITAFFPICDRPMSLEEAMTETPRLLRTAAANVLRAFMARGNHLPFNRTT